MKKILIMLYSLPIILLSACFPTGERIDSSSTVKINNADDSTDSIPAHLDMKLDDNLIVNADISAPNINILHRNFITFKEFDETQLKDALVHNKKIADIYEETNAYFTDFNDKYIYFEDGASLIVLPGSSTYRDTYYEGRQYLHAISGNTPYMRSNLKDIYQKKELENVDKIEAIKLVEEVINEVGISNIGNPDVIALDLESLKSEWVNFEGKHGEESSKWEKADEAYVITFPVLYENVEITDKGYIDYNINYPIVGSRIMGIVSKNGLIYMAFDGIYDIGEKQGDNITPITLESALEKVKNKYKDIILTDPVIISNISLEYVPVASNRDGIQFELTPAWVFTSRQEKTLNVNQEVITTPSEFSIMINAETGQEIVMGGPA